MGNNNTLLIIGNGICKDFCKTQSQEMDPSSPFGFDVPYPSENCKLLDLLPNLNKFLKSSKEKNDFDKIELFIENHKITPDKCLHYELRQYISLAYSHLNQLLTRENHWKWAKWLKENRKHKISIISFNYDLILETTLGKPLIDYYRIGSTEEDQADSESNAIPIFKPHGSCDFDIDRNNRLIKKAKPFQAATLLNNVSINGKWRTQIVPEEKLHTERTQADIVLPMEKSIQNIKLLWVKEGYETALNIANKASICYIIGLSYSEVDQPEIDSILDPQKLPQCRKIRHINLEENALGEELRGKFGEAYKYMTPAEFFKEQGI